MVSKPFVCENNEAARGIKVEELPGNFGHPWATQNGGQPLFVWYPTYFAGLQFFNNGGVFPGGRWVEVSGWLK